MKLPVLMYHQITADLPNPLAVAVDRFDRQMSWLSRHGYTTISCIDAIANSEDLSKMPPRPILITFDDAYRETYTLALPILEKYNMKATVFVPAAFAGSENTWDGGGKPLMSIDEMRMWADRGGELGIHGWDHKSFDNLDKEAIENQIEKCRDFFVKTDLPYVSSLAFPYGADCRKNPAKYSDVVEALANTNIRLAFRIGCKNNRFPFVNKYAVMRANIRGVDAEWEFPFKVWFGRVKPF